MVDTPLPTPSSCIRRHRHSRRRHSRSRTPACRRSCAAVVECHDDEDVHEHEIEHHEHDIHDHHYHDHDHDHHHHKGWFETGVAMDQRVSLWVYERGVQHIVYVFLRLLEFSGDGVFLIPCAAATFLAPPHKLTPEVRMFFFNLLMSFIFDLIFVSILKKMVRRPRPAYNHCHFQALQVDHWSFPSGHSTRALITTTLFGLYMPMWRDQARRIWVPYLATELKDHVIILKGSSTHLLEQMLVTSIASVITFWAFATTTSRIILGRHFLCDVLAGSIIGVGEAMFSHRFLFINMKICEYVHSAIIRRFARMEYFFYTMNSSKNFVVTQVKRK